jgi:DNA-binding transcriptional LysR family regulator
MDLRALRAFVAVAEAESFTRAGQRLEVSQSAISQQIRSLEDSVGAQLFVRQARRAGLTQAGNVLLPYARQILSKVDEALAVVSDFEAMGRGRIMIGAGATACHHVLPQILRVFSQRFAKIEVHVISGFTSETLRRTLDGTIDLGLVVLPVEENGVVATDLGRDEIVAIAPPNHRWAELERIRPKDFVGESLVVYNRNSHTFRIVERYLLEAGVFPTFGMEISDHEAVKKMVEAGLGVSVVANWTLNRELKDGSLIARPLAPSGLFRSWGVIRRANEPPTASQRSLMTICQTLFPRLIAA